MKEYIEREAAIAEIMGDPSEVRYPVYYAEMLKVLPAADVRPVVKAKIVDMRYTEDDGEWKCSHCGWQFTLCVCGKDVTSKIHFCPNCGAWMEES